jgi:hypothetical protein
MREQTAGYYRTQAERLRWQAIFAANDSVRRQLLVIAGDYEELAKTVETIDKSRERLAS